MDKIHNTMPTSHVSRIAHAWIGACAFPLPNLHCDFSDDILELYQSDRKAGIKSLMNEVLLNSDVGQRLYVE